LMKRFGSKRRDGLEKWAEFVNKIKNAGERVDIGIVGKYTDLSDSYISIAEAFHHAGAYLGAKVNIKWIEAEDLEHGDLSLLNGLHGILVPGGFGMRGADGKINAIEYAREHNIPFLGICFGFQLAVVEYGKNVLNLDCNSTEIDPETEHPVITILPEQEGVEEMGGTMRLGAYKIKIKEGTLAHKLYGKTEISERHRHRYEVNPEYIDEIEKKGLVFSGRSADKIRMEIAELPGHKFFIASQFHPEFKSRPLRPAPLFYGFVEASLEKMREVS